MALTMYRDCMTLLDEVRILSLSLKSPQGKLSSSKKSNKRNVEDTPTTIAKRRKR